jgi:hypothetical protein
VSVSRLGRWLGSLLAVSAGCANVLGIEDAELDQSFNPDGTGGTDGTDGTGGRATEGGAGEEAGRPLTLCEQYCQTVEENCTGEFEVYTDTEICLRVCSTMMEGQDGDESGNTVHCRLHNAELAGQIEENVHCPIAGPGGNGVCGTNCESFCMQMVTICEERIPVLEVDELATVEGCQAVCVEAADLGGYDTSLELQRGDTVQCRLYHVSAATLSAFTHCEHAAALNTCVD